METRKQLFNFGKLCKAYLLLFIVGLFPQYALGQNIIYEQPMFNSEEAIIRHYKDDVDIRMEWFSYDYVGCQIFNYVDRSTGNAYFFPLSVDYWIEDFEILNGYVYFCGTSVTRSFFGYFNIDSVFFHNDKLHFLFLANCSFLDTVDNLYSLDMLDVYEVGGVVHLAMTGHGYSNAFPYSLFYHYGYFTVDTWKDVGNTWKIEYVMDYSLEFEYHDIAATANKVVVVGTRRGDINSSLLPEYSMTSYLKPSAAMATQSMYDATGGGLNPFMLMHYMIDTSVFSPMWRVKVIRMDVDSFVTACAIDTNRSAFSLYSDPAFPAFNSFFIHDNGFSNIRYSSASKSIVCATGFDYVLRVASPYSSVEKVSVIGADINICTSLDSIPGKPKFIISGTKRDYGVAKQWLYDANNLTGCVRRENVHMERTLALQKRKNLVQNVRKKYIDEELLEVKCQPSKVYIECK